MKKTIELIRKSETIKVTSAEGSSILACVDENGKPKRVPEFMYPGE